MEATLRDPSSRIESRGEMNKNLARIKHDLEVGMPPDTTPLQRDALAREEAQLRNSIVPDMLSQEELRKCPPGAIGAELKFQKRHKKNIIRWKNIRRILHKGDDDPDVANLELFRGKVNRLNMDNAVIPGAKHFVSPNTEAYKDGYDRTFGEKEDAQDEQLAALMSKIEKLEKAIGKQSVSTKAKQSGENAKPFTVQAKCGKDIHGSTQGYAENGKRAHERRCAACKPTEEAVTE